MIKIGNKLAIARPGSAGDETPLEQSPEIRTAESLRTRQDAGIIALAMRLTKAKSGAMKGQMRDLGFDSVGIGISAMAILEQDVAFSHLAIASDSVGPCRVALRGRGAGAPQLARKGRHSRRQGEHIYAYDTSKHLPRPRADRRAGRRPRG